MAKWDQYKNEADSYYRVANGAFTKEKFGEQVIYNMISMSIENYLTALCFGIDEIPEHSEIAAMICQISKKMELPDSFTEEARFINSFMNLCSLEVLETKDPSRDDLKRMLGFNAELKAFSETKLSA